MGIMVYSSLWVMQDFVHQPFFICLGLGAPVVPFYPFSFWVPLLKPNSRKKGTLIIKGLLGNLVVNPNPKPEACPRT